MDTPAASDSSPYPQQNRATAQQPTFLP
eukprot:gene26800-biopygen17377